MGDESSYYDTFSVLPPPGTGDVDNSPVERVIVAGDHPFQKIHVEPPLLPPRRRAAHITLIDSKHLINNT